MCLREAAGGQVCFTLGPGEPRWQLVTAGVLRLPRVVPSVPIPVAFRGQRATPLAQAPHSTTSTGFLRRRSSRGRDGYIGYFENAFGEQLVFVHDDGEPGATLYHGDLDWDPRRVSSASGLPDVGDLILNREEHVFVCACWIATTRRRDAPDQAGRTAA